MFNKSYNIAATERANKELENSFMKYNVKLLDDSVETFNLSTQARGVNLLDSVCDSLELLERDYFGIQYLSDNPNVNVQFWKWMKMDKLIRKQNKGEISSKILYLRVRFVPNDIYQMLEVYTRYQLFLQIKHDIYTNRISCSKELSVQLAGHSLQSELGDHNTTNSKLGYVGEFRFIQEQTPSFEAEVANFHKSLRGTRAEDAELKFLTTAKQMAQYGCDLYNCELIEKPIQFGFHALGISIFTKEPHGSFVIPWNSLDTVSNRYKSFMIKIMHNQPIFLLIDGGVEKSIETGKRANLTHYDYLKSGFKLTFRTNKEAKESWRSCIESHSFFRVRDPIQLQRNAMIKRSNPFFKLVTIRTLFTGRRTLPELVDVKRRNRTTERSFIRTASKRYMKRQPEKPLNANVLESGRLVGIIHGKYNRASSVTMTSSKEKIKNVSKTNIDESGSESSSENLTPHKEPDHIRPKSMVTQSVRVNKGANEVTHSPTTHSTMPRKQQNIYSKSLSVDENKKYGENNVNDGILKVSNNQKTATINSARSSQKIGH